MSRLGYGDKLMNARGVGVEARPNTAAAMHREVGFQRIASTSTGVRAMPASLVKRAKQELRELRRCERHRPMTPYGLPSLGHQRVRGILSDELRQVGRLEREATLARHRDRRRLISYSSFGISLSER